MFGFVNVALSPHFIDVEEENVGKGSVSALALSPQLFWSNYSVWPQFYAKFILHYFVCGSIWIGYFSNYFFTWTC